MRSQSRCGARPRVKTLDKKDVAPINLDEPARRHRDTSEHRQIGGHLLPAATSH